MNKWAVGVWVAAMALGFLVSGSVTAEDRGTFANPLMRGEADPFLTYVSGRYYLLNTGGREDGFFPQDTHEMAIRSAPTLLGLRTAKPKAVYTIANDPDSKNPNNQFYESPELYEFNGRWYIYYTSYANSVKVIESDTDNPLGTYHAKATLTTNTYDATLLQMPDKKLYLLGSTYGHLVIQSLSNPYTTVGQSVEIAQKDQSWEHTVIEAPEAVWHKGQLTLLYSAGGYNKDDYGVGGLKFLGGDPMLPASWKKLPGPLLRGLPSANVWCAGVASPFLSPDGKETWFVYGGYGGYDYVKDLGIDPRIILAQPLHWNADNTPSLGVPAALGLVLKLPSGDGAPPQK